METYFKSALNFESQNLTMHDGEAAAVLLETMNV